MEITFLKNKKPNSNSPYEKKTLKNTSIDFNNFNQKNNLITDKTNFYLKSLIGKTIIPKIDSEYIRRNMNKFDPVSICTSLQIEQFKSPKNPLKKIESDNEKMMRQTNNSKFSNYSNKNEIDNFKNFEKNLQKHSQFERINKIEKNNNLPLKSNHNTTTNNSSKEINEIFQNEK